MYIKFDKDSLYENGEEELIYFSEIEDFFQKIYEIIGFATLNEGMTLSIKGPILGKIIHFNYKNGSLLPMKIQDGHNLEARSVIEEDRDLISEVLKYGAAQHFSHYVLSNS
jgi:hypothetical protein